MIQQKLLVGAEAFAQGQPQSDNENTFQLPEYVDAFAAYFFNFARGRLTPKVNFINPLDKRYFLNTSTMFIQGWA